MDVPDLPPHRRDQVALLGKACEMAGAGQTQQVWQLALHMAQADVAIWQDVTGVMTNLINIQTRHTGLTWTSFPKDPDEQMIVDLIVATCDSARQASQAGRPHRQHELRALDHPDPVRTLLRRTQLLYTLFLICQVTPAAGSESATY